MRKKIGRIFGILMISALVIYGLVRFVFPLEVYHYANVIGAYVGGARSFSTSGPTPLTGYVRDFCDPADPEARGCTCIAFIHGLADSALTWKKVLTSKSSDWKKPVRIYALQVDHESKFKLGDDPSDYQVRHQAHAIARELKSLCPSFVLVGNSMGGWIATWIALDQELPVSKLILSSSVGLKAAATAMGDLEGETTVAKIRDFDNRAYFTPHDIPDNVWDHVYKKFKSSHIPDITHAQIDADLLDEKLSSLKTPTMIIWGDADRIAPLAGGRLFEKAIRGSLWRELHQCGHIPQKECTGPYLADINEMLIYGSM